MRTFVAIELEPAVKRGLVALLRTFPRADGVRWVNDRQLHLTLKFLGEVGDSQISGVCEAVAQASEGVAPFDIRIAGLGVFPAPRNPRVLWCGVEDATEGCRRWVERADPLLADLGFKPETRAYTPHITLGRSKSTAGGHVLRDMLETADPPDSDAMLVTQVVVFESRLLPTGAQYRPVSTHPLRGG
jgi:2'-5' RNA ligase